MISLDTNNVNNSDFQQKVLTDVVNALHGIAIDESNTADVRMDACSRIVDILRENNDNVYGGTIW